MVLDATRGSIARFINHSCAPNCRMIKWTVSGKPRMALFAGDNGIMTGEELTYDYNFDPFSAKNVQECRCGAEGCRGVLGPKPKEIKEALRPIATGGKRKLQQVMEDAVETVTKKRKIAVPSSVKSAFANVKAQTSRRLSQAAALTANLPQKERLTKKSSERSLREVNRKTIEEKVGGMMRRRTTITYSKQCSSVLTLNGANGESLVVENETKNGSDYHPVKKEKQEARLMSKKDSVETKPISVAANVVRTIRRSERGTPGKTIFVIGDDEFKGWR